MAFERFIARRYLRSKRQIRFINIIMLVSVIGITVGVAVLVVMLSVFNGFNGVVTGVLVSFDPHVRVEAAGGRGFRLTDTVRTAIGSVPGIRAWSPFVASKALLVTPVQNRVALVRGVVDSAMGGVSGLRKSTIFGEFALAGTPGSPGLVLGLTLADRLGAVVGAEVAVVSPAGAEAALVQFGSPPVRRTRVTGIYDSNNKDYDLHYAFIDIETARQLFRFGEEVSGVEIRLDDIGRSEETRDLLAAALGPRFRVLSWYDLHRDLYSVMQIERWGAFIVLSLIIAVASFNVLGSLTMGVVEKRRDIGVLRAMGSTRGSITRIFMFEGLLVGVVGTLLGIVLGLLICWAQITWHVFALDPSVYIIPAIPVEVRWADLLTVAGASMSLSGVASLIPALRAARLTPVEAIRWE